MGFSRQGYWIGLPFPSPVDLPNPGIEPRSPALQADSSLTELQGEHLLPSTYCLPTAILTSNLTDELFFFHFHFFV